MKNQIPFSWESDENPDVERGFATFMLGDKQHVAFLPSFQIALNLAQFMGEVYEQGKIDGVTELKKSVKNVVHFLE